MANLILDDVRDATGCAHSASENTDMYLQVDWDIVKSYDEFVEYIQNNPLPERISYDHDLADDAYLEGAKHNFKEFDYSQVVEKTGYHAVMWMLNYCIDNNIKMPDSYCHSMNPYGKMKILSAIQQYTKFINVLTK